MTNPQPMVGRHRRPEPVAVVVHDTDPNNPVNDYRADMFPLGAAITIAYGSTTNMFTTLGNLYRILGYLNHDERDSGVPCVEDIDWMIDRYREYVRGQLPITEAAMPPPNASDDTRLAFLTDMTTQYGPTVTLTQPTASDMKETDDVPPSRRPRDVSEGGSDTRPS